MRISAANEQRHLEMHSLKAPSLIMKRVHRGFTEDWILSSSHQYPSFSTQLFSQFNGKSARAPVNS